MSGVFFVLRCKSCGQWQVKEVRNLSNAVLKCIFCSIGFKIKRKDTFGLSLLNYGPYSSGREAALVCQAVRKRDGNSL